MQGKGEVGHRSRWMAKNTCIKGLWFDSHLGVYDSRKEGTKAGRGLHAPVENPSF